MSTIQQDRIPAMARLWRGYAEKVYGPGYPLYRELAHSVAENEQILEMILECRSEAHDPNMLLAAVQYLVTEGRDHPLADHYRQGASGTAAAECLLDFCARYRDELTGLMNSHHIQTNETGRCSGIALGLAAAATEIGEPIGLVDAGASAGLNLSLDEYLLDFGPDGHIGPAGSPVRLPCELRGDARPQAWRIPAIARRAGIDRAPVDLDDPETVRWMMACIWPGNGRQERASAAIAMQAGRPSLVRTGDMVEDLPAVLAEMRPGPMAVVTSWSYSYLPPDARERFQAVLAEQGREGPVAWVCCDLLGTVDQFDPGVPAPAGRETPSVLGLAVYEGETVRSRALAFMHSHGSWLEWLSGK